MAIRFDNRVAIVTGAGGGLGRAHALELAARGAKVVVNDLGGALDGTGGGDTPAQKVVDEIKAAGGDAIANGASVTDYRRRRRIWSSRRWTKWGRIDILVANAGILRDKTFAKMELDDFAPVMEVHLMGSVKLLQGGVGDHARSSNYGRIVVTTSSSGLLRQFRPDQLRRRQAGAGRLHERAEARRRQVQYPRQCLAPTAATRMTDNLMPPEVLAMMKPEAVSPAVLAMVHEDAPNRAIINAGASGFERTYVAMTKGVHIPLEPGLAGSGGRALR